jgi:hypothetical protein
MSAQVPDVVIRSSKLLAQVAASRFEPTSVPGCGWFARNLQSLCGQSWMCLTNAFSR